MQVFIGGAHAGKRQCVSTRFPAARWVDADQACADPDACAGYLASERFLAVTGWGAHIEAALTAETDDGALREQLCGVVDALCAAERTRGGEVVLIVPEMGRGIVPMSADKRRLRDVAGWFAQDAATRAAAVWYVRHGLVQRLK